MTVVYNGGTYDLLHPGHLHVFRQCRVAAGPDGLVVISLNTDEFVEQFKGHRPVQEFSVRAEMLRAIKYIDRVVENFGGADSRPAIELVAPDWIMVGRDWWSPGDEKYCHQMGFTRDWLEERHIGLRYMDFLPGYSSTTLRSTAAELVNA